MGDFLDFELEDLSAAFNAVAGDLSTADHERVEIGYQDEHPTNQLRREISNSTAVLAHNPCSDHRTILPPPVDDDTDDFLSFTNSDAYANSAPPVPKASATPLRKRAHSLLEPPEEVPVKRARTKAAPVVACEEPTQPTKSGSTEDVKVSRERKCVREKQRRAELNTAYSSLAKTLSLPQKCNKTALLQKADSTIRKLRKQLNHLQSQSNQLKATTPAKAPAAVPMLPPWMLAPLFHAAGQQAKPKTVAAPIASVSKEVGTVETTEKALMDQVQACIDRMVDLRKTRGTVASEETTHKRCA